MSRDLMQFTKMHALGNDFVVVNTMANPRQFAESWVRQVGDRNRGIGFDQLLVIGQTPNPRAVAQLQIYNSDGSSAEQCGNGVLCVSRYLVERELTACSRVCLQTGGGLVHAEVLEQANEGCLVRAELGVPSIESDAVPFIAKTSAITHLLALDLDGQHNIEITPIAMGNPHAVVFDESNEKLVESVAKAIQQHDQFPNSTNVEFVNVVNRTQINVRVFERGAGETQACGTGACASVVAARLRGLVDDRVSVQQRGGEAIVEFDALGGGVALTASAVQTFEGVIKVD